MAGSTGHHDLYIALFARTTTPRTYHWALLICASDLPPGPSYGVRYHVTDSIQNLSATSSLSQGNSNGRVPWRFEAQPMATLFTASPLLARVLVSRITGDPELVSTALGAVPLVQDDRSWTYRVWVRDALASLAQLKLIELPDKLPEPRVMGVMEDESARASLGDEVWKWIEESCRSYLDTKHEIGRWRVSPEGRWVEGEVPTWDLAEAREIVA